MFEGKCLKCGWVGKSADCSSQWFKVDEETLVAPGIVVGNDEYKQRYSDIDLEKYKQQMSPELFKAFVRHIGRIPGTPDLNLGDIVTTPE